MRIEKNRELLRKFFVSVKSVLKSDGEVFMSLCDGQGGTPADNNSRHWNDSWQVTEMAAHGDFVLVAVEPFDESLFESYTVTGYRSLEKQFNTQGSLTHIFRLAEKPNINNIMSRQKINLNTNDRSIDWKDIVELNNIKNIDDDKINLSLYPRCYKFDITLLNQPEFSTAKLYEILYNYAGLIISNIEFLGSYKFPDLKETKTYRITYKSNKFPLYRKLSINLHENVITEILRKYLGISVSR